MDSMRHLSTSLPGSRRRGQQTHRLLADFKAAALSVTNLYKTAAAESTQARETGYQDALDDLLTFLDKENIGLDDGEGWRIRQWATGRLDDKSDEEGAREERAATRSSSPETQRKPQMPLISSELAEEIEQRPASEPPQQTPQQAISQAHVALPTLDDFTFRAAQAYPTNHDRETVNNTMDLDNSPSSTSSTTGSVRQVTRPPRSRQARNRENRAAAATLNFNLGSGAGNKRKMPYSDFFDLGSTFEGQGRGDGKDGSGRGGKRSRNV